MPPSRHTMRLFHQAKNPNTQRSSGLSVRLFPNLAQSFSCLHCHCAKAKPNSPFVDGSRSRENIAIRCEFLQPAMMFRKTSDCHIDGDVTSGAHIDDKLPLRFSLHATSVNFSKISTRHFLLKFRRIIMYYQRTDLIGRHAFISEIRIRSLPHEEQIRNISKNAITSSASTGRRTQSRFYMAITSGAI